MKTIAVLCCSRKSVYHSLPGVECYDERRDAMTFGGGMPIVAHPPCRAWSAFCSHQAKPAAGEKELGLWCCDMLRKCGGVLEQPAHSRLFAAGGLPMPGTIRGNLWSLEVWQKWWGHDCKKNTWLCFCGVDSALIDIPLTLHPGTSDKFRFAQMSSGQRSRTPPKFAHWLVDIARQSSVCLTGSTLGG